MKPEAAWYDQQACRTSASIGPANLVTCSGLTVLEQRLIEFQIVESGLFELDVEQIVNVWNRNTIALKPLDLGWVSCLSEFSARERPHQKNGGA